MNSNPIDQFYALSSTLTGYNRVELLGTGVGQVYYDTVQSIVGEAILTELLETYQHLQQTAEANTHDME